MMSPMQKVDFNHGPDLPVIYSMDIIQHDVASEPHKVLQGSHHIVGWLHFAHGACNSDTVCISTNTLALISIEL